MNILALMTVIEKAAPLLASMVGGPYGALIVNVVELIAHEFGYKGDDLAELAQQIAAHPEATQKLQALQSSPATAELLDMIKNAKNSEIDIKIAN